MPRPLYLRYAGLGGSALLAVAAARHGADAPWAPTMTARTVLAGDDGWLTPLCWLVGSLLLVGAWVWGRHAVPSLRWAYVTAGLWALPLLFVLPLGSYDIYSYACQGWALGAGHDPYAAGVQAYGCPWLDAVAPTWRESPAPYGPVFLLLAALAATVGGSLTGVLALLRVIALLGVLLLAVCLPALARHRGVPPERAVWLVLACPLVPIHLISGAHNDAVMIALLVAALSAVARGTIRPADSALAYRSTSTPGAGAASVGWAAQGGSAGDAGAGAAPVGWTVERGLVGDAGAGAASMGSAAGDGSVGDAGAGAGPVRRAGERGSVGGAGAGAGPVGSAAEQGSVGDAGAGAAPVGSAVGHGSVGHGSAGDVGLVGARQRWNGFWAGGGGGRLLAAGALIGLAGGVKATALVVLPFVMLVPGVRGRGLWRGLWVAAGAGVALLLVSVASGLGFGWVSGLVGSGVSVQWTSPPTAVGMTLSLLGLGDGAIDVMRVVGLAGLLVVLGVLWLRTWRGLNTPGDAHTSGAVPPLGGVRMPGEVRALGEAYTQAGGRTPGEVRTSGGARTPGEVRTSGEAPALGGARTPGEVLTPGGARTPGEVHTSGEARTPGVARTPRGKIDPLLAAGVALAATVVLAPVFHPWYLTWPLAVLAATLRRDTLWLVVPCAVAAMLCLPDGYNLALAAKAQGAIAMTVLIVVLATKAIRKVRA